MPKPPRQYVSRFSVSLPQGLLADLDAMIRRKGYRNRSLAVADMVRDGLVEYRQRQSEHEIAGTVTLLYDHHKRDLTKALTAIQHDHHHLILATLHVHLDHDNCLEVIAVRGRATQVHAVADRLIATKGVKHGKLTVSSTGRDLVAQGVAMHIPDGFINVKTAAVTGALAAAGMGVALRHASKTLPPQRVPLLGLSAAFVFAAQMLNFPVAGGTSGHLIGAVLAAALLGPSAAVVVISAVLIVQCFVFADGGVTALGANIFNMALVAGVGGWAVYRLMSSVIPGLFGRLLAATVAGWCSTVLASIACAGQLAAAGTVAWSAAFPTMAAVHMLIGIGEGMVTALVLSLVWTARPDLLSDFALAPSIAPARRPLAPLLAYGLLISLGLALFISPFASSSPDGLDKTAQTLGFEEHAAAILPAPLPDYEFNFLGLSAISTSIAGLIGTLIVFALAWALARALVRKASP